ncbi:LOW QUALITY PROTEIN: solute carrier family 2, facilitated glucose transporter member 11 [Trichechus inunguis]
MTHPRLPHSPHALFTTLYASTCASAALSVRYCACVRVSAVRPAWLLKRVARQGRSAAGPRDPRPALCPECCCNVFALLSACDLERVELRTPPDPSVSDAGLLSRVEAREGIAKASHVHKYRVLVCSGVRLGSDEHAGVHAEVQGRVLLLTICAAGIRGTFQFGYNLSIINAPTLHIQEFTSATWRARTGKPLPDQLVLLLWLLIVSLYPLGGLFRALPAGPLAIVLGREKSILVNNIFVVAAAILFGFSHKAGSFEIIMLGRLPMGVSARVSMNIQPMYLGESAPKELRGAVAMTSAIFTALGIVMGQVVGLRELLGGPHTWPLLLSSCLVPGVLQLASLPLLPESPCYLLTDCRDIEACLAADAAAAVGQQRHDQGWWVQCRWELICDWALQRQGASLVELGSAVELCENDLVYACACLVFWEASIPEVKVQYAITGTGSCKLLTAVVSCVVIERVGWRVLLMWGYCVITCWGSVVTATLCLQSSFPWMPYLAISSIFAFILSFGISPAGVTGILATELFDQTAQPTAYVVCGVLLWTMLFLAGLGFPFVMEGLSCFLCVPFLVVCVCGAVYTGLLLPKTKGKTFLEISEEFHRLNFPIPTHAPRWRGPEVIRSTEL